MADMENTVENDGGVGGGEGGVLRLKRSELAILRRYASRYPIVEGERQEVVDKVMETLRTAKTPRTKLGAAMTIAALDRVNLDEMKTYLSARSEAPGDLTPVNVQVQVNNVHQFLNEPEYLEYLRKRAVEADCQSGAVRTNGQSRPVENGPSSNGHRPGTNGDPENGQR